MWTDKTIDLSSAVPSFFNEIYEYQQLFSILTDEIELLQQTLINYKDDLFFVCAGESVVSRYQNLLKTSGSTVEQKRSNIISKFSETVPFNMNSLKNVILMYVDVVSLMYLEDNKIYVYYKGDGFLNEEASLLNDVYNVIPANLQFLIDYHFAKYSDILLNYYEDFAQMTWLDVKLSA